MRLLKIEASGDFSLVELNSDKMQPYAILSHVWGEKGQEVTFRDLVDKAGKQKAGYQKIELCAKQAQKDGLEYFWIDTCCIDKSSSAELSEAINSMYSWYEEAMTCYAYLSDVSESEGNFSDDPETVTFAKSKWFTRGWTLQELIAPPKVVFYSKEWTYLGTKTERATDLHNITGIDGRVLGGDHPSVCSIADRMSWMSKRITTREEDIAYSLLGIFDINMPLLYGEKGRAFIRLQEEIMKVSDDQSIFAWNIFKENNTFGSTQIFSKYVNR
ncbi:HET-domain-containing protein [Pyrenochaeta sp. DS3sAY3a]|nr:HET-domain-containing protein [Pyrenochaeta sp. DS3sAY3a]